MKILSTFVGIIVGVLGVSFALLNAGTVNLNYYLGNTSISLSLLLVFAFAFGIFVGMVVELKPLIRLKRENRQLRRRVQHIAEEVETLKSFPLKGSR